MSNSLSSASADQLKNSLQILINRLREIIDNVSDAFKGRDSMDKFLLSEPSKLFEIVALYKDCFQSLQIEKRHQLDSLLAKHYRTTNIEEYANGLLEAETNWDELLDEIDTTLITEQQKSSILNDEIKTAGAQVMLVTFGPLGGAKKWLEETNSSFPFFQDPSRNLYTAFGMTKSVKKVFCIASMVYYAEQLCSGQALPKPYEHFQEDIFQMGGDVIITKSGSVTFTYCSKVAVDRPSVDHILQVSQKPTNAEEFRKM